MSSHIIEIKSSMYEEKEFEWEIPEFFKFRNPIYESTEFSFGESRWICSLWNNRDYDYWDFSLVRKKISHKMTVEFKLGFKKLDGSVLSSPLSTKNRVALVEPGTREIYFSKRWSDTDFEIKQRSKLYGRDSPYEGLTFVIIMKRSIAFNPIETALPGLSPVKLKKLDTLSENFKSLLADKNSCDVSLLVKQKEFKAHKTVLMARSPVFTSMFHHDTLENQTGIITIPDCNPDTFHMLLEFLYTGKLETVTLENALHLYRTSDKYNVQELKTFCVECLERCLTKDSLCDVVILADLYDETKLLTAAQEFFNKNADKVIETAHWNALMKNNPRLTNQLIKEMYQKLKK